MKIDFKKLGIEKAFADLLKEDFTDETKQYLRDNIDISGSEYITIKRSKQPAKKVKQYPKEQQAMIDKFIEENGFEEVEVEIEPEKPNYRIELIATQKAKNEVMSILLNATRNTSQERAKFVSKLVASKIKKQ